MKKQAKRASRKDAINQILTYKARISCIESDIMEIAVKNGFDPYVFIKHDFTGDAVAIDTMVTVIAEDMAKIDQKELKDYYINKLAEVCLKARSQRINDKAFVITVRALTGAFQRTIGGYDGRATENGN